MGRVSKITKFVEYPLELDLSPYMSPDAPQEGEDPPEYALYGVVVHLDWMGSAHSGHYVSYVRLLDGRWCKCDDGRVEEADEATVLKQKAYLLFYERKSVRARAQDSNPRGTGARGPTRGGGTREKRAGGGAPSRRASGEISLARRRARVAAPEGRVVPEHTVETVGIQRGTERENGDSSSSSDDDSDSSPALPIPWPRRGWSSPTSRRCPPLAISRTSRRDATSSSPRVAPRERARGRRQTRGGLAVSRRRRQLRGHLR